MNFIIIIIISLWIGADNGVKFIRKRERRERREKREERREKREEREKREKKRVVIEFSCCLYFLFWF